MDEPTRAWAPTDRPRAAGGVRRRAIIVTIALWMVVLVGLYVAIEIVRSPAFVA